MTVLLDLEGAKIVEVSTSGPGSYDATNGFNITVHEAKGIVAVLNDENTSGYTLGNMSFKRSSNVVTVHIFTSGGSEVADGTDLSGTTFKLVVLAI